MDCLGGSGADLGWKISSPEAVSEETSGDEWSVGRTRDEVPGTCLIAATSDPSRVSIELNLEFTSALLSSAQVQP
jgi:hypothetical protein